MRVGGNLVRLGLARHPTYTSAPGPPDLKPLSQPSKALRVPSVVPPAVERVQQVMAPDTPITPGRTKLWGCGVGTWEEAGRANAISFLLSSGPS